MDLLKETLELSDNATELLCNIEKIDYIASDLITDLEKTDNEGIEKSIIKKSALAVNIMFDYIDELQKSINKTIQQTDAVFKYVKEQAKNGKEIIEN